MCTNASTINHEAARGLLTSEVTAADVHVLLVQSSPRKNVTQRSMSSCFGSTRSPGTCPQILHVHQCSLSNFPVTRDNTRVDTAIHAFVVRRELFKDGYDAQGNRIYDKVSGMTCHQCRQKTLGLHTSCSECQTLHVGSKTPHLTRPHVFCCLPAQLRCCCNP